MENPIKATHFSSWKLPFSDSRRCAGRHADTSSGESTLGRLSGEPFVEGLICTLSSGYLAKQLQWPSHPAIDGPDISLLELYIDFVITTNSRTPRNIFTKAQRDKLTAPNYVLDDIEKRADVQSTTLGAQTQTWCKAITWLLKFTDQKVFPSALKKKAVSINRIGSSATMKGLEVRPRLVNNDAVIQHLREFFNTDSGMNRSLDRNFDWNAGTTPIHPVELNVPFAQRARAIRRARPLIPSPPQISCFLNYVIFLATVVLTVRQLTVRLPTSHAGIQCKSRKNPVVRREPRSQGYSYSLLNGEPRSYLEFSNHLIAVPFPLVICYIKRWFKSPLK